MSKDEEGEPVITDLKGASIVLSPKWAEDPELPFVRPATPVKVTNPRREKLREQAGGTAFIFPDQQIPYHDERACDIAMQILADMAGVTHVVNLGDLIDFPNYSRFDQELRFIGTTPEAIDILLNCNQADLNAVSRQVAELNKKWDRLQEERVRLIRLQREVKHGEAHR